MPKYLWSGVFPISSRVVPRRTVSDPIAKHLRGFTMRAPFSSASDTSLSLFSRFVGLVPSTIMSSAKALMCLVIFWGMIESKYILNNIGASPFPWAHPLFVWRVCPWKWMLDSTQL
ncbi:hypothetical protein ADUPG1_004119 [Aduncisulcus paluster]|uniref:Uncharacterized protein n=1 Tax=Aduncisulcus paluster TaxID=2918883 RepID=A0ABQ5JT37_9EUKA|nr:hypothetical protein ADUPG1_004119 [Aduncisulcus paluster]